MRKIEREMIQAIIDQRNWSSSNTTVKYDKDSGLSQVFLHGHNIAEYGHGDMSLAVNNCGYETNTTKSRLNSLINHVFGGIKYGIFQKNWNWFVTNNGTTEDFPSGYWYVFDNA
tara:strand:+ start:255 stop:596 length:342 start_codon:yes stop_codon:yes gene_type:complete